MRSCQGGLIQHGFTMPKKVETIMTCLQRIRTFLKDEEGPTAVEYAVVLMLIFAVLIAAVQVLGLEANESIENSRDKIVDAMSGS